MKILNIVFLFIINLLNFSCSNSNQKIEKYDLYSEPNSKPIFSINYDSNSESKYIYQTHVFGFYNDSVYPAKFSLRLRDKKIFAKLNEPKSNEFTLFDLNSKLKRTNKIVITNSKTIKTFDYVLEQKITTKKKLQVNIFRIKKWGKLPDFFGGNEIDLIVFVTEKYGVIGSYFSDIDDNGKKIRFGIFGDTLLDYIDYSNIREVSLE